MNTHFDMPQYGFAIRPAGDADRKAHRMLLPGFPEASEQFVAIDGKHGLVVGAAAAAHALRTAPRVGPGVAVHVIPPCRKFGVGRALIDALADYARQQSWDALYAAQRVLADGEEFRAWQALGFRICETVEEHELPLERFVPRLAPLIVQLQKLGRIPAEARIVPLHAADPAAVLQLHLEHLGGDRDALDRRIRGQGPESFHPRYSRVLLLGDRTVGCLLAHRKSQTIAAVDANIVLPEFRGDWANVWLKLNAAQGAQTLGVTHFHFTSFDHYADTRRFATMLGGVTTKTWTLMVRDLAN